MAKKITIEIDDKGNCKSEGHGFRGSECTRFMREIDAALGQRTGTKRKPEMVLRQNTQKQTND